MLEIPQLQYVRAAMAVSGPLKLDSASDVAPTNPTERKGAGREEAGARRLVWLERVGPRQHRMLAGGTLYGNANSQPNYREGNKEKLRCPKRKAEDGRGL